ncbi:uroplakin-3b-like protein 1 isoform X1 [Camelus bactrianus]|uniref:Uroplakin-3b-like protein 1 isoform X1 n=1 Tax=Camelus bactrianus TaxID=9837 RepID=A0A9W3EM00_CAMBA|nr:uroplakin-3b-like protein 1 isoform X1 [Camelus bactrianus]
MPNPWGQQIQPLNLSNQLFGRRGHWEGWSCQKQPPPAQHRQPSLWGSGRCRQTLGQTNGRTPGLAMGLSGGQSLLLMPLWLLLSCLQLGTSLERIGYVPQLSSATLAGRLTQSTLTLEQPRGQFSHLNISDFDAIWLVVAHSKASQNFTAPQRVEDTPVPASFSQRGYYLTLMANRALYPGDRPGKQLRVLRVGNDTRCSPRTRGCNHPLPGPGPYRMKFLVMSDRGPVAETEWSSETRLQQAEALQAVPGPQSAGTVVIIAILSVLLAVLLTALLTLLIYTCYDTCGSTPISGSGEPVCVRRYDTHHVCSPPATGGS